MSDELSRAEALLDVDDAGVASAEVEPAASELGADDAKAYRWPDGVIATVYEFGTLADARGAQAVLAASTAHPQTNVNGGLLLQVTAPADDSDAASRAKALVSGFAGRE
jgi:hypothetical protein